MPVIYGRTPFSANVLLDNGRVVYVSMIEEVPGFLAEKIVAAAKAEKEKAEKH